MKIPVQSFDQLRTWMLAALLTTAFTLDQPANLAADQPATGTLEDYLQRLGYQAIEFERNDHTQDFVIGSLSNGRKQTFLVDTGWGMTAVSKSAAQGLKDFNDKSQQQPGGETASGAETILLHKLTLGHIDLLNQPARVEELHADYMRLPFDAVLGCDFFFRNHCLIDCYKRRLYVRIVLKQIFCAKKAAVTSPL